MHGGQGQSLGYLLDAGPIRPVLLGSWFGLTVPWWCWLAHIQHTAIQGGGGLLGWVCCADGAHVGHWVYGVVQCEHMVLQGGGWGGVLRGLGAPGWGSSPSSRFFLRAGGGGQG